MKPITQAAWDRVLEKACQIANATESDNDPMFGIYQKQMLEILDDLEKEFGPHSEILDTRADYIESPMERRRLYLAALDQARAAHKEEEVDRITDSLRRFEEEMRGRSDSPTPDA